jgi:hypothetical protein
MKAIWKYPLETTDEQIVTVPNGRIRVLTVQVQHDIPCLWIEVEAGPPLVKKLKILIYGTGHPIFESDELKYVGSYQLQEGALMFHVYFKE